MMRLARMEVGVALLAIVIAGTALVPAAAAPDTVSVDSTMPFTPTGLSVKAGQLITTTTTAATWSSPGSPARSRAPPRTR